MSAVEYYNHSTYPATGAAGSSASLRSELELVEAGFGKLPDLSGNGSKIVAVNSGGTALEAVTSLTVAQGGTGRVTSTTAYALLAAGTTATGAHQTLAAGATTEILVGGGASALPVWTTATGTGAPVRATNCALVTPDLGTPSALVGTNITGTAAGLTAGNVTTNANLTGHVTSVGNAAVLGSFTFAQLNTAVSDAEVARTDAANTFTGTQTFSNLIAAAAGSVGAPSIYMTGYATTGWYNIGADNWGFAVSGAKVLDISSTGLAVTGTIGASGTISSTASGPILQRTGASTAAQIIRLANTTGDFYFGIESSVAGSYFPTSSAYASVLYSTQPVQTIVGGVKITDTNAAGLAVTGNLNTATTTALSWGGDTTAGHTLGTRGTGSSLFINTGGLNTSYASGLAVDGSYSSLVSTVNIRALGTYSGGGYEAKLAFFTSSDTTQGQRMLLSSTGLAVTGTVTSSSNMEVASATTGVNYIKGASAAASTAPAATLSYVMDSNYSALVLINDDFTGKTALYMCDIANTCTEISDPANGFSPTNTGVIRVTKSGATITLTNDYDVTKNLSMTIISVG